MKTDTCHGAGESIVKPSSLWQEFEHSPSERRSRPGLEQSFLEPLMALERLHIQVERLSEEDVETGPTDGSFSLERKLFLPASLGKRWARAPTREVTTPSSDEAIHDTYWLQNGNWRTQQPLPHALRH